MTAVSDAMYAIGLLAFWFIVGGVAGLVAAVAILTAVVAFAQGPAFLLGASLLLFAGFGAGLLTMYAYVSSLGWERRGTSAPTVTVTSSQWTEPINTSTYR